MVESKPFETKYIIFPLFLKILFESNYTDQLIRPCSGRLSWVSVERGNHLANLSKIEPFANMKYFIGYLQVTVTDPGNWTKAGVHWKDDIIAHRMKRLAEQPNLQKGYIWGNSGIITPKDSQFHWPSISLWLHFNNQMLQKKNMIGPG